MGLDTKQGIANEFDRLLKIVGKRPGVTVEWRNFKHYARIYTSRKRLQVDEGKWKGRNKNWRLMVLLHELSHVTDGRKRNEGSHKERFWEEYIRNYDKVKANKSELGQRYNWDEVAKYIVKDVNLENIDRRQTTTGELRGRIESALGVQVDDRYSRSKYGAKFDEIDDISASFSYTDSTVYFEESFDYGPDNIKWGEKLSEEELWRKFKEVRSRDHSVSGSGKISYWTIPTPNIKEEHGKRSFDDGKKEPVEVTPCTRKDAILLQIASQNTSRIGVNTGCE